jgi:hypothetical protein
MGTMAFELRPGITNMNLWAPTRPPQAAWNRLRDAVLIRDNFTCVSCGHVARKFMNVHHLADSEDNNIDNLCTLCAACHAVMHMGLNLQLGKIEIWKSNFSQVEIVIATREGCKHGQTYSEINATLGLTKGRREPNSILWANSLLKTMGPEPRAELKKPLCAVFVEFERWQIES